MWIAVCPQPLDFCGRPPCPLCFEWKGGDEVVSGLRKMALDLLQKPLDGLSKDELKELNGVARKMHKGGVAAFASPPDESPPPPADIGMSSTRRLQGWLRDRIQREAPKPRQLTCDDIVARQAERDAAKKEKDKERNERLKEAREMAQILAEANKGQQDRQQYEEQQMLRNVDPQFVEYCRQRGIYSPQDIYARYQREYMTPNRMSIDGSFYR